MLKTSSESPVWQRESVAGITSYPVHGNSFECYRLPAYSRAYPPYKFSRFRGKIRTWKVKASCVFRKKTIVVAVRHSLNFQRTGHSVPALRYFPFHFFFFGYLLGFILLDYKQFRYRWLVLFYLICYFFFFSVAKWRLSSSLGFSSWLLESHMPSHGWKVSLDSLAVSFTRSIPITLYLTHGSLYYLSRNRWFLLHLQPALCFPLRLEIYK